MSALPEKVPELANFPDPRPSFPDPRPSFPDPRPGHGKSGLSLRPSVDTILQRMNPDKLKLDKVVKMDDDENPSSLEQEKLELREQQRQFAQVQADSMERLRVARELEVLLSARETVLDNREALLSAQLVNSVPEQKICILENSLNDSRTALKQANQALSEMEGTISSLRTEIEHIKTMGVEPESVSSLSPKDDYAEITDKSLEEQVAFLRERELFIEESENVLFEKAQHLQERESRLEQNEHDQMSKVLPA